MHRKSWHCWHGKQRESSVVTPVRVTQQGVTNQELGV